jgi:hypothetical protein
MQFLLRTFERLLKLFCFDLLQWLRRRANVDKISSLIIVYLFLQLLSLLWALLFNVSTQLALLGGQLVAKPDLSIVGGQLLRSFCGFYVSYATLRVFLNLCRAVHQMTWESLEDFPESRALVLGRRLGEGSSITHRPVVSIVLLMPVLLLTCVLCIIPYACLELPQETASDLPHRLARWICVESPLQYLTNHYPTAQRALKLTVVLGMLQWLQVLLHQFPNFSKDFFSGAGDSARRRRKFRSRGSIYMPVMMIFLVLLLLLSAVWMLGWLGHHLSTDFVKTHFPFLLCKFSLFVGCAVFFT